MTTKEDVQKAIDDNLFGEDDRKLGTFIFSLFKYGGESMSNKIDKDYVKWFNNLKKGKVINKNNQVVVGKDFEENMGVDFCLMMSCAKGYLTRA